MRSRFALPLAALAVVLSVGGLVAVFLPALPAAAHGAATLPGSRTYLCRVDGTHQTGDIVPNNPACAAAIEIGGKQPLWDWFGVLRGDGAGRTRGYIPDGQLCSGGDPKYAGYDLARADWPHTRLTAGATMVMRYNAWAAHPGEIRLYVTREGYDPTQPLRWDDLEPEPFSVYQQAEPNGQDQANGTPDYQWTATLPERTGRHIIYSIWERSDSEETFYGCSDVVFDGGDGEVVGVGPLAQPVTPINAPGAPDTPPATEAPPAGTDAATIPPAGGGDQQPPMGEAAPAEEPAAEVAGDAADGGAPMADPAAAADTGPAGLPVAGVDPAAPGAGGDPALALVADRPTAAGGVSPTVAIVLTIMGILLGACGAVAVLAVWRARGLQAELATRSVGGDPGGQGAGSKLPSG